MVLTIVQLQQRLELYSLGCTVTNRDKRRKVARNRRLVSNGESSVALLNDGSGKRKLHRMSHGD